MNFLHLYPRSHVASQTTIWFHPFPAAKSINSFVRSTLNSSFFPSRIFNFIGGNFHLSSREHFGLNIVAATKHIFIFITDLTRSPKSLFSISFWRRRCRSSRPCCASPARRRRSRTSRTGSRRARLPSP